jgi:hypothetical protein
VRLAGLIAAAAILLAGCNGPGLEHFGQHTMRDGDHSILCVTWKLGYAGGLSCDWGHPR